MYNKFIKLQGDASVINEIFNVFRVLNVTILILREINIVVKYIEIIY